MTTKHKAVTDYRLFFDGWPISESESRAGGFEVREMFRRGDCVTYVVTQGGVIRVEAVAS